MENQEKKIFLFGIPILLVIVVSIFSIMNIKLPKNVIPKNTNQKSIITDSISTKEKTTNKNKLEHNNSFQGKTKNPPAITIPEVEK